MNHNMFRTMVAGGFAAAASLAVAGGTLSSPAALGALAGPAAVVAVTAASPPDVGAAPRVLSPQGFIMSDGRICNPRWGC